MTGQETTMGHTAKATTNMGGIGGNYAVGSKEWLAAIFNFVPATGTVETYNTIKQTLETAIGNIVKVDGKNPGLPTALVKFREGFLALITSGAEVTGNA